MLPQVEVLEGKDAGKQGKVVQVIRQRNWVVLEGLNTVSEEWGGDVQEACPIYPFLLRAAKESGDWLRGW